MRGRRKFPKWFALALAAFGGWFAHDIGPGLFSPTTEALGERIRSWVLPRAPLLRFHVRDASETGLRLYVVNEGDQLAVVHRLVLCPPGTAGLYSRANERAINLKERPRIISDDFGIVFDLIFRPVDDWQAGCGVDAEAVGLLPGFNGGVNPGTANEIEFSAPGHVRLRPFISSWASSADMFPLCAVTLFGQNVQVMQLIPCSDPSPQ
jgi:hypothetical protein